MAILTVELIDPQVRAILEQLAKMNLIKIKEDKVPSEQFANLLNKLRANEKDVPDPGEISAEVEAARALRKQKNG
ncbi:MAG: hypothetical protein GC205_09035 [Bacteroidetes bacterium]|nr:hypothetical protein [Bacteroidota bacterium]